MEKKAYQSVRIIEITEFDNVANAQKELSKYAMKVKLGMILTLCALPYTIIMLFMMGNGHMGDTPVLDFVAPAIMVIALGATLIGAVMVGVLGIMFRLAKKVIYWCWLLVPIFPIDLGVALVGGVLVFMSILVLPALYLVMGTYAAYRAKCSAKAYLTRMMAAPSLERSDSVS